MSNLSFPTPQSQHRLRTRGAINRMQGDYTDLLSSISLLGDDEDYEDILGKLNSNSELNSDERDYPDLLSSIPKSFPTPQSQHRLRTHGAINRMQGDTIVVQPVRRGLVRRIPQLSQQQPQLSQQQPQLSQQQPQRNQQTPFNKFRGVGEKEKDSLELNSDLLSSISLFDDDEDYGDILAELNSDERDYPDLLSSIPKSFPTPQSQHRLRTRGAINRMQGDTIVGQPVRRGLVRRILQLSQQEPQLSQQEPQLSQQQPQRNQQTPFYEFRGVGEKEKDSLELNSDLLSSISLFDDDEDIGDILAELNSNSELDSDEGDYLDLLSSIPKFLTKDERLKMRVRALFDENEDYEEFLDESNSDSEINSDDRDHTDLLSSIPKILTEDERLEMRWLRPRLRKRGRNRDMENRLLNRSIPKEKKSEPTTLFKKVRLPTFAQYLSRSNHEGKKESQRKKKSKNSSGIYPCNIS
jgi:hypothetical protein